MVVHETDTQMHTTHTHTHSYTHTHTATANCSVHLQTGSGKTFTIYGSDEEPGLTRHGIHELFKVSCALKSIY
jgi:hypothetical protein